ncbi:putative F-box protein-like isoform X4 [Capsicum annuum]|nr:putative F-box protein-like isoform X4 [Capsicum annuum]KAF3674309.1 putative F-box protein-like isoform X4 [Capsicum annuum]
MLCYDEYLNEFAQFDSPFKCSEGSDCFNIVGSCNGILCLAAAELSHDWNHFYFLNPSIRKSFKLPEPIFTIDILGEIFGYMLGFGYDPVTNDYKVVVRVLHTLHSFPPHVDVYKLSIGVWEDISHVSLPYKFFASTPHAYVNGSSHWIVSCWVEGSLGLRGVIVFFDMHDEKFSELILPSSLINESRPRYDEMFLFVLEGSLCLVDNNYDKSKPIDIWIMREYGAPNSWVKQFIIQSYHFARTFPLRTEIFWTPYINGRFGRNELGISNGYKERW